jgi:hypothetical protein
MEMIGDGRSWGLIEPPEYLTLSQRRNADFFKT